MSKSVKRVKSALAAAGQPDSVTQTGLARTARDAATALDCAVDQIAKSILFAGTASGTAILFITAGANLVDPDKASALAGEQLGKADAQLIRRQTGFAIGGVAPIGHLTAPRAFFDPRLHDFDTVWAAAGTPNHVFSIDPGALLLISGAQEADFVTLS